MLCQNSVLWALYCNVLLCWRRGVSSFLFIFSCRWMKWSCLLFVYETLCVGRYKGVALDIIWEWNSYFPTLEWLIITEYIDLCTKHYPVTINRFWTSGTEHCAICVPITEGNKFYWTLQRSVWGRNGNALRDADWFGLSRDNQKIG